ncbi:GMC family oxidoreductase [Lacihabitans sp. LS3-19]|uniref:GMC family oxidoreductase N-terminal domain-containing protein n=1 Tax=Lacihabitans sp. LS3-19 TaxID=2487335 RepID=UPI0020CB7C43|nr:GMC family oxidoreductase [Lacihabitans sp. LS3-19]MCP9768474.1 GMC family oxidoreductase [Lacihabitans sp. LS3-19]
MKNIFEYTDYTKDQTIKAQVCIIGSGCGGTTLAKKLAKNRIDVVVLEKGGYYTPNVFDNRELNMSGKIDGERNFASTENGDTFLLYGNNVGGASVHYWADTYRTPTDRLVHWEQKYGIKGHTKADLDPAWDELTETLSVAHPPENQWNKMNILFKKAVEDLGWGSDPILSARKNCQGSGHCQQGCFYNAKQSQLITHLPTALDLGARLYADMQAEKLVFEGKKVKKLIASAIDRPSNKPSGIKYTFEAEHFVVAAGGYNSPDFLLRQPELKEKLPALGKYFGFNPVVMAYALFEEDIIMYRGLPAAWSSEKYRLASYNDQNEYEEGGYLLLPNQTQPAATAAVLGGFTAEAHEWMQNFNKVGGTIAWLDDCEEELGEISVNSDGKRLINYPYGPNTQKMIRDTLKKQVLINFKAGAKKVLIADYKGTTINSLAEINKIDEIKITSNGLMIVAPHPFGGCRMGADPKNSVVDYTHRVHGYDNLFVSDPSVFPTGPSVDPSFTIMAFSYIVAKEIINRL